MSSESPAPMFQPCRTQGRCPVCGEPNGCRVENGEAFKGPCWCEELVLSAAAKRRLSDELPEARCLCRKCLEALVVDPDVRLANLAQGLPSP
jgi:hypothetical protein